MRVKVASTFYNAAGVCETTDPACEQSRFAVDRVRPQLDAAIRPGQRVLDLGCNAGRFVFAAEVMGAVATGVDCAAVPLRHARALAKQRGSTASFIRADYLRLPLEPASFDVVLLINNIVECSYADAARLSEQVHRVLTPRGRLCVSMHDAVLKQVRKGAPNGYDASTGALNSRYRVRGETELPYDAHYWTVGFLKHVLSPRFRCEHEEPLADEMFWLIFRPRGRG